MLKTQPRPGEKSEFCRSLDWQVAIQWFGNVGAVTLSRDRQARIELDTGIVAQHFDRITVTILSNAEGKIDRTTFKFDDYLSQEMQDRTDVRDDYPIPGATCFELISHVGWKWYIAVPRTTRPICEAIEQYIRRFDPEMPVAIGGYETPAVIVMSTAHICEADGTVMYDHQQCGFDEAGPFRGAYEEGGWFCTYRNCEQHEADNLLHSGGWSDALINVLKWARKKGFDYVLFDRDGVELVDELPVFDW